MARKVRLFKYQLPVNKQYLSVLEEEGNVARAKEKLKILMYVLEKRVIPKNIFLITSEEFERDKDYYEDLYSWLNARFMGS